MNEKPWPKVHWDHPSLMMVAEAVMIMNSSVVYDNIDSCASYIRSTSERSLYRYAGLLNLGWSSSTGGWQVVFTRTDGENSWNAWPSVSPNIALRFAKQHGEV